MQGLNSLKVFDEAIVYKIDANENIKKRFFDIGLVRNTKVKVLFISPLKDMVAYLIKGAVIAIRKEDTEGILVKVVE